MHQCIHSLGLIGVHRRFKDGFWETTHPSHKPKDTPNTNLDSKLNLREGWVGHFPETWIDLLLVVLLGFQFLSEANNTNIGHFSLEVVFIM